jgi:hypothetical protein
MLRKTLLMMALLGLPALAESPQVLILPLDISGNYAPIDEDQLTVSLKSRLSALAPGAQLQVARSAELSAFQVPAGSDHPPSQAQADQLARGYGSKTVAWVSLHFTPHFDTSNNTLALAGAARIWAYSQEKRMVVLDQPLSLIRTGAVKDVQDEKLCRQLATQLTESCIEDLAVQLVAISEQQRRKPVAAPQPAQAPSFKGSTNYDHMLKAIRDYQRAERDHDVIDLNSSYQHMFSLWAVLTADEQTQVGKTYPSLTKMLNEPSPWGYRRPYYWPYYYGY